MQATAPLAPDVATNSSRRSLVAKCFLVGAVVLTAGAMPLAAQSNPPNVVVILVDDLGVEHLEVYNLQEPPVDYASTPQLDLWADQFLRFDEAVSNPECSPTRATLQSGLFGFRTGIGNVINDDTEWGFDVTPGDDETLAEQLEKVTPTAYTTAAFGKWHLGTAPGQGGADAPTDAGFDTWKMVFLKEQLDLPNVYTHYWVTDETLTTTEFDANGTPADPQIYLTHNVADWFIEWEPTAAEPWFAYVAFTAPHSPFHCPPEDPAGPYPDEDFGCVGGGADPVIFYHAMIQALDIEIDRMLSHLAGIPPGSGTKTFPDNTFIVIASDNGSPAEVVMPPVTAAHSKCTVFEGGTRVPLFVAGKDLVTAGVVPEDEIVNLVDLYTTILQVGGAPVPPGVDAINLSPFFTDPTPDPDVRAWTYTEVFEPNFDPDSGDGPVRTMYGLQGVPVISPPVTDRYKHIIVDDGDGEALFNLTLDPWEGTNLLGDGISTEEAKILTYFRGVLGGLHGGLLELCTAKVALGEDCSANANCCSGVCAPDPFGPGDICTLPLSPCGSPM